MSIAIWITFGIGSAYLGWVWLERHNGDLRLARTLRARNSRKTSGVEADSGKSVRITQFYALPGEMTDADHTTVCYGVENAKDVRITPPVENVWPTHNRCFWVEPRQDTTYTLTAEGFDGTQTSAAFEVHVKPAPPSILFVAVSHAEIQRGDPVTVCYGVTRAKAVRLDPVGMRLAPIVKNCTRFFPSASLKYNLVASGVGGTDSESFAVRVHQPPKSR